MREAKAFLKKHLSSQMLEEVDLYTLNLENSSYLDDKLKKTYSDKLLSANSKKDKDKRVYILIELQVQDVKQIVSRTEEYNMRIRKQHMRAYNTTKFPAIINIIIYSGKKPYQGHNTILEAFDIPEISLKNLHNPLVVNLREKTIQQILQDNEASLFELLLKVGAEGGFYEVLENNKVVGELINKSSYKRQAILYIIDRDEHRPEEMLEKIHKLDPETKQEIMSGLQLQLQQTKQEGILLGMQKGKAEGKAEGMQLLAQKLLQGGYISQEVLSKLIGQGNSTTKKSTPAKKS